MTIRKSASKATVSVAGVVESRLQHFATSKSLDFCKGPQARRTLNTEVLYAALYRPVPLIPLKRHGNGQPRRQPNANRRTPVFDVDSASDVSRHDAVQIRQDQTMTCHGSLYPLNSSTSAAQPDAKTVSSCSEVAHGHLQNKRSVLQRRPRGRPRRIVSAEPPHAPSQPSEPVIKTDVSPQEPSASVPLVKRKRGRPRLVPLIDHHDDNETSLCNDCQDCPTNTIISSTGCIAFVELKYDV